MRVKQAKELFNGAEKYNCTQAILAAFQDKTQVPDEAIKAAAKAGHGRALEGYCGALYALKVIIDDEVLYARIEQDFAAVAGSSKCREIRKQRSLSCVDCVTLAAELMVQHVDALRGDDQDFRSGLKERIETMLPTSWWKNGLSLR